MRGTSYHILALSRERGDTWCQTIWDLGAYQTSGNLLVLKRPLTDLRPLHLTWNNIVFLASLNTVLYIKHRRLMLTSPLVSGDNFNAMSTWWGSRCKSSSGGVIIVPREKVNFCSSFALCNPHEDSFFSLLWNTSETQSLPVLPPIAFQAGYGCRRSSSGLS